LPPIKPVLTLHEESRILCELLPEIRMIV
jgi:hypothetical protein